MIVSVASQEQVRQDRTDTVIESTALRSMYEVRAGHDFTSASGRFRPENARPSQPSRNPHSSTTVNATRVAEWRGGVVPVWSRPSIADVGTSLKYWELVLTSPDSVSSENIAAHRSFERSPQEPDLFRPFVVSVVGDRSHVDARREPVIHRGEQ